MAIAGSAGLGHRCGRRPPIVGGEMTVIQLGRAQWVRPEPRVRAQRGARDRRPPRYRRGAADTDRGGQGKSGAIADGDTIARSRMDARHQLKIHKSEVFFDELGDSLQFESRTNVNDLVVVLVGLPGTGVPAD
jgi:glycerate-2-kinase